jgi:hypothetical protein
MSDFIFLVQILGAVGLGILVGYLIERYLRKKEEEETRKQKEEEDRQFYQTSEPPGILDDISPLGYVAIGTAGAFALVAGYELLGKRTGLFTRGLTKTVRGDGNCFYRSIAEFVYGDQRFWEKVKRELKEFSESGRSDVVNMLKAMGGSEYDDVKQLLNKPNEWARGPIIQLAREYYKHPIEIVNAKLQNVGGPTEFAGSTGKTPWQIMFMNGDHYEPVSSSLRSYRGT